jgi:molybdopterin-guanine dinucleotide biosynthesis protein A
MEPLPVLYRRECLKAIEQALARGERSLRELLSSLRVRTAPAEALRRRDPRLLSYLNVNSRADLARARTAASGYRPPQA